MQAISSWETYNVRDLKAQVNEARNENKYLFIWDKFGHVGTYFRYQGLLIEFDQEFMKVKAGRQTANQAMHDLNDKIKTARGIGQNILIDLGNKDADFKSEFTSDEYFNASSVFDREQLGQFDNEAFTLTIRSAVDNEEDLQEVMSKIPNIEKFRLIIIE